MRIEIVHQRDPDESCGFVVYVDGVRAEAEILSVDAGAGYTFTDWADSAYQDKRTVSPAVWAEVLAECYADPSGAEWITDLPDDSAWIDHLDDTDDNRRWWADNLPTTTAPFLCDSIGPSGAPCVCHYRHNGRHRAHFGEQAETW